MESTLYDAAGTGTLALPVPLLEGPAPELFCLAILARASRMEEPLAGGAAAALCTAASADAGGLPGGVVETSRQTRKG